MNSDFQEIAETLNLAKLYIDNLDTLKSEICSVERQVVSTFEETQRNIVNTFSNLKQYLCQILDKRQCFLLNKAEQIKSDGLQPLVQCKVVIESNIERTKKLIEEGSNISQKDQGKIIGFLERASVLGNLPEVPESKEVPYISFHFETSTDNELENLCSAYGEVYRTAPIQIKSVAPKPGALLIEWQQTFDSNDDRIKDIQEFKLQRAYGNVTKEKQAPVNFLDCYTGPDTQYLLRDIQICQAYSFRVCCKFDGTTEWSPWSVVQVGSTDKPWFCWEDVPNAILSNERRIATPKDDSGGFLMSDGPQVSLTDSVEFTILEVDEKSDMVVALSPSKPDNLAGLKDPENAAFTLDSCGKITIDGAEKATVLAPFSKGLKLCFSLEPLSHNKVRVNLDCQDKRVTYDWSVGEVSHLYFGCQMHSSKWKVMVE